MPYTVCVCHRQSVSITGILCLSQTICVCHRQSLLVTHSLFLSQTVFVCHMQSVFVRDSFCLSQKVFVGQSLSLSKTLFNHPWSVFHLFIDDFDQDLFVRFEFVRGFNPTNPYFVDPWPGLHEIRFVRDCNVLHTNFQ